MELMFSSQIFKDLLRQLLQGKALSIEDTIDLLTLKDNESSEDYATSLHLLNYAKVGYILCSNFGFNFHDLFRIYLRQGSNPPLQPFGGEFTSTMSM